MKEITNFLSKFQFYPCENSYTGCEPQNNARSNIGKMREAQKKIPIFIAGDCSAPSFIQTSTRK